MFIKKIIIALIFFYTTLFYCQVTTENINDAVDITKLKHPYLYFNEDDKPALFDKIKNDKESNDIMRKLLAVANKLIYKPVPNDVPIQGKNTRAGWTDADKDSKYSKFYSEIKNNAFQLAFVYQMTGDKKYASKAFEFADIFCDLPTWTQRAHEFPIIYSRIMPWNVSDDQVNFSFDHYTGDSGRIIAAVYDWLYPALSVEQRDRIRGALLEKVITKVRGNYEYHWWATAYRCNWCGVCNSGVGLAGIALLTEDPQLTDVIAESYNRINNMYNELGVDGGWQEGGAYWNYGINTSVFFADALKRLTKGKYNLFENKRFKNNPITFPLYITLPSGKSLNFEDSNGGRIGSTWLINKISSETGNKNAVWYRNKYFNEGEDLFDIIWSRPNIKPEKPKDTSIRFRSIDWWVMRSDFADSDKVIVAGKAGLNNDPHHGHLDVGQFVLTWRGQYFISELGRMYYDEKYFDDNRWNYPHASSEGHNVIFVNDEIQLPGKMRKQPWNYDIGGKIVEFRTSDSLDYVIMDPTNAYPKKELKSWRRHIVFEKPIITFVLDEIKSEKGTEIEVRFHSECNIEPKEKYVLLKGEKGLMVVIPVTNVDFNIKKGKHAIQPVNAEIDFKWEPYFSTVVKANTENTVIGSIILPVEDDTEALNILNSLQSEKDNNGNYNISFLKAGLKHSYNYKLEKDGLVLN